MGYMPVEPRYKKIRLALLLGHPTGQDKQCIAEAIQKPHERRIQRLLPPQLHTHTCIQRGSSSHRSADG